MSTVTTRTTTTREHRSAPKNYTFTGRSAGRHEIAYPPQSTDGTPGRIEILGWRCRRHTSPPLFTLFSVNQASPGLIPAETPSTARLLAGDRVLREFSFSGMIDDAEDPRRDSGGDWIVLLRLQPGERLAFECEGAVAGEVMFRTAHTETIEREHVRRRDE